ncbi:MAG: 2-nitropropane dioxygenase, partial [Sphaerospermopsis sp. SIO1G2]|nr:2-nitropropane dioxygenase [Sphaerospermopsis sp. SIO1G2]
MLADVTMAPAADMFEMGVKLQVLKRGTMFAMRAGKLYELYRSCDSLESIPAKDQAMLEKQIFRTSLADIWNETAAFWGEREPSVLAKAQQDPKHKMA